MGFKAEIGIQLILARSKGKILGDQFVLYCVDWSL